MDLQESREQAKVAAAIKHSLGGKIELASDEVPSELEGPVPREYPAIEFEAAVSVHLSGATLGSLTSHFPRESDLLQVDVIFPVHGSVR